MNWEIKKKEQLKQVGIEVNSNKYFNTGGDFTYESHCLRVNKPAIYLLLLNLTTDEASLCINHLHVLEIDSLNSKSSLYNVCPSFARSLLIGTSPFRFPASGRAFKSVASCATASSEPVGSVGGTWLVGSCCLAGYVAQHQILFPRLEH